MKKPLLPLLAACLWPLAAYAEETTPYALPIATSAAAALQRLTLPADVYRLAAFADLRDLRVLDAQDAAQPFAFVPEPPQTVALLPLPLYALPAEPATSSNGSRLQLQADASGSIRLELATKVAASPQPVRGYLLDRGPEPRQPLTALQFDWHSAQAELLLTLQAEQSDDLQHWQPLAAATTLAQLDNGQQQLRQGRLPLQPGARYLRLTLQGELPAGFRLTQARAEIPQPAPRALVSLPPVAARKATDGGFEFDLGGRYPLQALQFGYSGARLLLPAELLSRPRSDNRWQSHGMQLLQQQNGAMPALPVAGNDRYWRLLPDNRVGTPVPSALRLSGQYRPADIVFVAQGEPPYRLQFGDSFQDRPGALAYTTLVPPNGAPAEPGQAAVNGRLRSEAASWLGRVGHLHWRKLALWAVLLGGVGLMLSMVLRLGKQTGR